jgi:hypothetical protein
MRMILITDPLAREHAMTEKNSRPEVIDVIALLAGDGAFIRRVVRAALQEVLEAEMTEAVGTGRGERTASRVGYRSATEPALGLATGRTRGTGATSPKRAPISPPGSASGRTNIRGWSPGSRRTSRKRRPSTGCRGSTMSI